ncbi:MAG: 26S protease regulatory subunit [Nitrospinota bacterium]|nr:MAG: 26S protease regulatory subunit [Nitrospinota bacterium]
METHVASNPEENLFETRIRNLWNGFVNRFGKLNGKIDLYLPSEIADIQIGGLEKAQKEVESFSHVIRNPEIAKRWGTEPSKGLLLYGPVGTGKTLLAKLLASKALVPLFHLNIPNLILLALGMQQRWVEFLQRFYELIGECQRAVVFFDEIDLLGSEMSEFFQLAPGFRSQALFLVVQMVDQLAQYPGVIVVGATDRPEVIGPQLIKRGRFQRLIEVPLPNDQQRKEIMELHIKRAEQIAGRQLFDKLDYDRILPRLASFSGANIADLIQRVLGEKVRQEGNGEAVGLVTTEDILEEVSNYEHIKQYMERIFAKPSEGAYL